MKFPNDLFAGHKIATTFEASKSKPDDLLDGLCIVDVESGVVVSRMWTQKEQGGCRVSNIVLGKEYAFITGSCGVLTLPLTQRQSNKDAIRTEL
eukprot:scaffold13408_cov153-Skeletonema_marinoi.AAC.2